MSLNIINPFVFTTPGGGGGDSEGLITTLAGLSNQSSTQQRGWEFQAAAAITVTHLRLYPYATMPGTTQRLYLWRVSDTTLLASKDLVVSAADAWEDIELDSPIALTSGQNYVVSRRSTDGGNAHYRVTNASTTLTFNTSLAAYVGGRVGSASDAFPSTGGAGFDILFVADAMARLT